MVLYEERFADASKTIFPSKGLIYSALANAVICYCFIYHLADVSKMIIKTKYIDLQQISQVSDSLLPTKK